MRTLIPFLVCCLPAYAAEIHVGKNRTHATVGSALEAAADGDVIKVHGGIYQEGNLRIGKSVSLEGIGRPVLDGAGSCEILTVTAPGVRIRGFDIRHGGANSLEDQAGIRISGAEHVTVEDNRISQCNFGIYVAKSKNCVIAGNEVLGDPDNEQDTGNGIHLWYCENVTVKGNSVAAQRDGIYLEFATDSVIEDNVVEGNLRYGLHFMFSHGNAYLHNAFVSNGSGVAVMYSRKVEMTGNYFGSNWGNASYGLLLKEMTDGRITGNAFERNTTGISMDGSNRMTLDGNEFLANGWAIRVQSSCSGNRFEHNNFSGNSFDVAADGELDDNGFKDNYWDKYEGYDLRRDGVGDVAYRPVSLYAVVVNRVPPAVLLLRSPVVHVMDRAEKAFPSMTPETVIDETPAMRPHELKTPKAPKTTLLKPPSP